MEIIKKIKELSEYADDDDILYKEYQICDLLETADDKEKYIPYILEIMENNPLADFGCPGPLVHFMESCDIDIYEKFLKESIKKRPAIHTLIMLNRLYNGRTLNELPEYMEILENICKNASVDEDIRNTAEDFLNYQSDKLIE